MSKKEKQHIPNPDGKGGFADNPQNRANGRWRKEDSVSYWMNRFLKMSVSDMKQWEKENKNDDRTFNITIPANASIKMFKSRLRRFTISLLPIQFWLIKETIRQNLRNK